MGMERTTPPQCTVDGSCSGGAYSIQSCLLRHAAYITSFFSSRHQGVDLVGCGLTPHLLCEGATDRTHHASLGPLRPLHAPASKYERLGIFMGCTRTSVDGDACRPPDKAVFVTSARPRSARTRRLAPPRPALVLHLLFISSSPPLHRRRRRVDAPSSTSCLVLDLRVRSSGACRQSTGRAREHFSGTDARWDVPFTPPCSRRSHRRRTFRAPPHPPPPLYLSSTLDTVTPPPSSISAPVSILTPAQSFPMRARARTMQDARCAGRRTDVEERGWMEGGYGGAAIGMERREEVGEEQGVGTEGGARRRG
ncbi:hypothetical protein B0H13DRAFT_2039206 [Mycena leptocephala]|nr:hypothetical protein B0H13DRAFT_2039206 [Mycena leptocephala]